MVAITTISGEELCQRQLLGSNVNIFGTDKK